MLATARRRERRARQLRYRAILASMKLFTSSRERRLWSWALAVVVAVYSTLGLAGRLAELLGERGLLPVAFTVAFVAVVVAIVWSALKSRPGRHEIWIALGITAVYAMVVVRMGIGPAERTHLFEYGLLAILIYQALLERRHNGRRVPVPALCAIVVTALLGWLDEGIQAFLPNRVYDVRDVAVNALAGLMAITAFGALYVTEEGVRRGRDEVT